MANTCRGPLLWNSVPEDFEARTGRQFVSAAHCSSACCTRGIRKKKRARKTAINSAGEVRKSAARNRRRPAQRAFSSCALFFCPCRLPWFPHCAHPLSGTAFALAAGQPDRRMRGPPAICILFPGVVFPPPRHPASPLRLLIPDRRPLLLRVAAAFAGTTPWRALLFPR